MGYRLQDQRTHGWRTGWLLKTANVKRTEFGSKLC